MLRVPYLSDRAVVVTFFFFSLHVVSPSQVLSFTAWTDRLDTVDHDLDHLDAYLPTC